MVLSNMPGRDAKVTDMLVRFVDDMLVDIIGYCKYIVPICQLCDELQLP